MEAIIAILPPLPHRIISLATAWAVMKTPVMFTYHLRRQNTSTIDINASDHGSPTHLKHSISIFRGVVQCRRLLLYPRRRNQPIELSVRFTDTPHNLVQLRDIADVDLTVVECITYTQKSAIPHFTHNLSTACSATFTHCRLWRIADHLPSSSAARLCTR